MLVTILFITTLLAQSYATFSLRDGPMWNYQIIKTFPHDHTAFTQGLYWESEDDQLYEGTGLYQRSQIRKVNLEDGKVTFKHSIPPGYFGEGICRFQDFVYQLTWQNRLILVYHRNLTLSHTVPWPHEGWGITHNNTHLIISDGTTRIFYVEPVTLKILETLEVWHKKLEQKIKFINELEFIKGYIWANVWQTDYIVQIDPHTAEVVGVLELSKLRPRTPNVDVLNGIAYNEKTDQIYVTGKLWPNLYEIKISPKDLKTSFTKPGPTFVDTEDVPPGSSSMKIRILIITLVIICIATAYSVYYYLKRKKRERAKLDLGSAFWL